MNATRQAHSNERAARAEKAAALATMLATHGLTPADAAIMDENCWSLLALAANVNAPSVRTQQMVISMMTRSN